MALPVCEIKWNALGWLHVECLAVPMCIVCTHGGVCMHGIASWSVGLNGMQIKWNALVWLYACILSCLSWS